MTQIPLYTTRGDWAALLVDGYLFNPQGEWIGWVEGDGRVFSVVGLFVGTLTRDGRIMRPRSANDATGERRHPPAPPARPSVPSRVPLAPLMGDVPFDMVEVLNDEPDLLHTLDADPAARDMGE